MEPIEIKENQLEEILREQIYNAKDFPLSGWRIPIYVDNDGEIIAGSWLAQGSWQPGKIELTSIKPWEMDQCYDYKGNMVDEDDLNEEDYQGNLEDYEDTLYNHYRAAIQFVISEKYPNIEIVNEN